MRLHWPILRTAGFAALAYALLLLVTRPSLSLSTLGGLDALFFAAGLLYTQLFEHAAHRFPMHRRIRFLEGIRLNHLKHHRMFHGARFQTEEPAQLEHIAGRYGIFPVLLFLHYAVLRVLLSPNALMAFLCAATLHYVAFEVSHWFTHLKDNRLDRWLERVPVVAGLRSRQVEHHRLHHELPEVAFNFNPPYLGDRITARMPRHAAALGFTLPDSPNGAAVELPEMERAPAPPLRPHLWQRPGIRAASAVVAGVAVVSLAVLASRARWFRVEDIAPRAEIA